VLNASGCFHNSHSTGHGCNQRSARRDRTASNLQTLAVVRHLRCSLSYEIGLTVPNAGTVESGYREASDTARRSDQFQLCEKAQSRHLRGITCHGRRTRRTKKSRIRCCARSITPHVRDILFEKVSASIGASRLNVVGKHIVYEACTVLTRFAK
jgi:hypothetical protein